LFDIVVDMLFLCVCNIVYDAVKIFNMGRTGIDWLDA